eukprot:PhM_4_TR14652/c2_g4_i3/m.91073
MLTTNSSGVSTDTSTLSTLSRRLAPAPSTAPSRMFSDCRDTCVAAVIGAADIAYVALTDTVRWQTWRWGTGPELGVPLSYNLWESSQSSVTHPLFRFASVSASGWKKEQHSGHVFICEYGGTPEGKSMFRGTTKLTVRSSRCNHAARASYAYKGTCHVIDDITQISGG